MRKLCASAIVVALVGILTLLAFAQADHKKQPADVSCARSRAIEEFKKAVLSGGGTVDSVHVSGGIAIVVTAGSKGVPAAIQRAAKDYLARTKGLGAEKGTSDCAVLSRAISAGRITETEAPFGAGALLMITSRDKKLEKLIQEYDCCKWCGPCGPNSTATCCTKC